jgi:glycosyltransferase involved in cell wall biosynthesis
MTTRRGRALVLTPWWPYPQDNGSRQRLWALIGGLREHYDVDLLGLVDEPIAPEHLEGARERCAHVEVVTRRPFRGRSPRALLAFFAPVPRAVIATYTPEMRAAVDRLVAAHRYDVVVVSQIHVARYAQHLRSVPRVLDDFEVGIVRDAGAGASFKQRARQWLTWTKVSRYAKRCAESVDVCAVVSEQERAAVLELAPNADVVVVPNGVDLERNQTGLAEPQRDVVVHAGALSFFANLEAVQWFVDDVWPKVLAARPGAQLLVTGRNDGGPAAALAGKPGVVLTGYVPDIRTTVAGAWCSIAPQLRGGGTRLKILESLALGTPVVATSKGAEGLDLVAGRDLVVADGADDFASALVRLLESDGERNALAANGRAAVEARYGWGPIVAGFVEIVDRLAASAPGARDR